MDVDGYLITTGDGQFALAADRIHHLSTRIKEIANYYSKSLKYLLLYNRGPMGLLCPSGEGCDVIEIYRLRRTLTGSTQLVFGARSENELRLVLARRTKSRVLPAAQCYRSSRRKLTHRPLFTHSGQRPSGRDGSSSLLFLLICTQYTSIRFSTRTSDRTPSGNCNRYLSN